MSTLRRREFRTIGFTGTRRGMTEAQARTLRDMLVRCVADRFVHGDCVGADAQAHEIATMLGLKTEAYPADIPGMRARCETTVTHPADRPLVRNRCIVARADAVFACPETEHEVMRSGTWSTVREARRARVPIVVIAPDGRARGEGFS